METSLYRRPVKQEKKESSAQYAVAARRLGKSAQLVNGEIMSCVLYSFDVADGGGRRLADDALRHGFVEYGLELGKIQLSRVGRQWLPVFPPPR